MRMKPDKPFTADFRDVAYVPRWAIARRIRQQYLAEHSYFTAVYADQIARTIGWDGSYEELFRYALYHDLDETITGDIPGPAKRAAWCKEKGGDAILPVMTAKFGLDVMHTRLVATDEIRAILSVADSIEEVCYLTEELLLGNVWVSPVVKEAQQRLKLRWMKLPATTEDLEALWKEHANELCLRQHAPPTLLMDEL